MGLQMFMLGTIDTLHFKEIGSTVLSHPYSLTASPSLNVLYIRTTVSVPFIACLLNY